MNKLILAAIFATGVVAATQSQAGTPIKHRGVLARPKTTYSARMEQPERRGVEYIQITRVTPTGTNIPVVMRRYNGQTIIASPLASYSREDLEKTGVLDVGTELVKRDSSLTFRSRR